MLSDCNLKRTRTFSRNVGHKEDDVNGTPPRGTLSINFFWNDLWLLWNGRPYVIATPNRDFIK